MNDFLAENNICGQTILQIVSNGNAIIAEILRLKDYIPEIYLLSTKEEQNKYGDIILDFNYFRISAVQDKKIEDDSILQDLDEEFKENHIEILTRFYLAFESIHQYVMDLKNFIEEINNGLFIQYTLENILQDDEGKQLLCESLYLYGIMLLIVDLHIPGIIRERLLVSYHRYSAQKTHGDSNLDDVCNLLRTTGFTNSLNSKNVAHYPDEYFKRIQLDQTFIEMVIGRLRSDDIYNQMTVYPLPEHRSTALANQASILFICLFFSPKTLHEKPSRMREIVDKFFSNNWIVSIYMGITVNLLDAWDSYKAARLALQNTIDPFNLKDICSKHKLSSAQLLDKTRIILKEEKIDEDLLMKDITKIINLIRECNVALRWIMLHTNQPIIVELTTAKKCKLIREQVISELSYKPLEYFELLLNTSQLELKVRDILKMLIAEKEDRWLKYKKEANDRIKDIADVFGGIKPMIKIEKNDDLKVWFEAILNEIEKLNNTKPNVAGRKIIQLMRALEEVQEFHSLDANMQIKQYLVETQVFLQKMIYTINLKEDILINLQLIGDLSYAWILIDNYTQIMQDGIKNQPNLVIRLRATFLKLSSALEIPLLRINQSHSDDLESVSQYYSSILAIYVRTVVQIIPQTMFSILAKIIHLQTDVIKEIPTRLDKDKLREYAQIDERFQVSKLTYSISVFTEGILMMQTTLVGVIELNPKQLLEDGIRKELVKQMSETLHSNLIFNTKQKHSELDAKLITVAKIMDGYKRSFEYVQDYINIHGLKIWQEEILRIMNYNVEKECNSFLRNKVLDWQSQYQSTTIPIPSYPSTDPHCVTFIGRLSKEILRITDPRITIYLESNPAWYDFKTHAEIINIKFASKITESIGPSGLIGLDKLYSFIIVSDMEKFVNNLQKNIFYDKLWIEQSKVIMNDLGPSSDPILNPSKFYNSAASKFVKFWPNCLDLILKIGQKQILRSHIAYELNLGCKFNSKNLFSSLKTMNDAVLMETMKNNLSNKKSTVNNEFLFELNKYLEAAGIYNPYEKIYIKTTVTNDYIPLFLFLFVISQLPKFSYVRNINSLVARKGSDQIDGYPFIIGLVTVFRQFNSSVIDLFVDLISKYTLSLISSCLSANHELSVETQTTLEFLDFFTRIAEIPKKKIQQIIPDAILSQYEYLSCKV